MVYRENVYINKEYDWMKNIGLFVNPIHLTSTNILQCVSKKIPDTIDCNLKKDCHILIIFGTNIPDTTDHQMTVEFPTSHVLS